MQAKRDENSVPTLLGVSSVDGVTPVLLYADPTTHRLLTDAAGGMTNPMTTGGDIIYGGVAGVPTRLANGSAGQVLQSNGTTLAPSWMSAGAGDMILASAQTNTGAKTFLATTLLLRNVANTFSSLFTNTNTAARTYILKDADGTVAFTSDITGTNSGTNTGDVTLAGTPNYITIAGQVITRALIDLTTHVTGILTSVNGGTGNGFTKFTGPTTAEKVFTLPDASSTILVSGGALGTPSSGTLTNATGLPAASVVAGILGVTGTRMTKGWFTDLEVTNSPTINGVAISTTYAPLVSPSLTTPTIGGVAIPSISSTSTLTNKRITKRVLALSANSATPAINTDSYDVVNITSQTAAITSFTSSLTGTPVDGDTLRISITGTAAVALTWGASFEASTVALPTTTVTTTRLDVGFMWNTATSKWRCSAVA